MLKNNYDLQNVGKRWLSEEDDKLVQEINDKKSFEDIALEHKRTVTAIKSRIISKIIYIQYKNKNKTIDELSSEYNIENYLIEKYINKIETNNAIKKSIEENNIDSKIDEKEKSNSNMELIFEKMTILETKILNIEKKLYYIFIIIIGTLFLI